MDIRIKGTAKGSNLVSMVDGAIDQAKEEIRQREVIERIRRFATPDLEVAKKRESEGWGKLKSKAKATPQDSDTLALVVNDLRTVIRAEGLDPLGATEREIGISQAVVIIARAIQAGEVGKFS